MPATTFVGSPTNSFACSGCVVARSLTPGTHTLFEQHPHPSPRSALFLTGKDHSKPQTLHLHRFDIALPAVTSVNLSKHSSTRYGCVVAQSFTPFTQIFPEQHLHPSPRSALLLGDAGHSNLQTLHFQRFDFLLPAVKLAGSSRHSSARCGCVVARSLTPGTHTLFEQHPHPSPRSALLLGCAGHSYLQTLHFQRFCLLLPA